VKFHGYPVEVSEEDGLLVGRVPDLRGCVATGATAEDLFAAVEDAVQGWLEAAEANHIPIPEPPSQETYSGKTQFRMPPRLHRRLSLLARREGVSLNLLMVEILAEAVGHSAGRQSKSFEFRTFQADPIDLIIGSASAYARATVVYSHESSPAQSLDLQVMPELPVGVLAGLLGR
jgi:antitoxin HicB